VVSSTVVRGFDPGVLCGLAAGGVGNTAWWRVIDFDATAVRFSAGGSAVCQVS